jgi:HPt (histidine-containing phosphotransfer) domain-containing protein
MTGGSEANYREVLALFCKDAALRLEILRDTPSESSLPLFITQVHALKSALASIGAAELSEKAALLEDAGRLGDMATIGERIIDFRHTLSSLTERISAALPDDETGKDGEHENGAVILDKETLLRLKDALEAEDISAVDGILKELAGTALDPAAKKALSAIADYVLMLELKEAADMVADLLKEARS